MGLATNGVRWVTAHHLHVAADSLREVIGMNLSSRTIESVLTTLTPDGARRLRLPARRYLETKTTQQLCEQVEITDFCGKRDHH